MNLNVHYDPESDAIGVNYGQPSGETHEIEGIGWVMIDLRDEESLEAIALEVIGISAWLPLGKRGYTREADTLTFGDYAEPPAVVGEYGDLITNWRRDSSANGGLTLVSVDLRKASKHLAPVMEAMSKALDIANR